MLKWVFEFIAVFNINAVVVWVVMIEEVEVWGRVSAQPPHTPTNRLSVHCSTRCYFCTKVRNKRALFSRPLFPGWALCKSEDDKIGWLLLAALCASAAQHCLVQHWIEYNIEYSIEGLLTIMRHSFSFWAGSLGCC